jgi:hypothetical protein
MIDACIFVVCCFEPVIVEFVVGKMIMIGILEYTTICITIIIRNFMFLTNTIVRNSITTRDYA